MFLYKLTTGRFWNEFGHPVLLEEDKKKSLKQKIFVKQ